MKIINVGKFPPPVGGVTYFMKRFKPHLDAAGINNVFFEISGIDKVNKEQKGVVCTSIIHAYIKLLFYKKSIVVFHSVKLIVFMAAFILKYKHKIVIMAHGETLANTASRKKCLYHVAIKNVDHVISTAPKVRDSLKVLYPSMEDKFISIPFILFPTDVGEILNTEILLLRKKHKYLMSGYAYYLRISEGYDVYGVDLMIELIYKLRQEGLDVAFVLLLPQRKNEEYYREMQDKIREFGIESYFLIVEERLEEASSLYKISDIYVRPTTTDGDAFSVRESLYVGTPVLASNAVARPKGCVLFATRNLADLYKKTRDMLIDLEKFKEELKINKSRDYAKELVSFFQNLKSKTV